MTKKTSQTATETPWPVSETNFDVDPIANTVDIYVTNENPSTMHAPLATVLFLIAI